ncbi:MAG: sugar ABC transporter substrate-binding protein, partial [Geminicoccaceae bacterium]
SDELFGTAFEIFQTGYLANEFVGLPVAEELMRLLGVEVQQMLDGNQSASDAVANAQAKWEAEF